MITPLAYLDPGTGSIIVQTVVAGILGFIVALKVFWSRIVAFFRGGNRKTVVPDKNVGKGVGN